MSRRTWALAAPAVALAALTAAAPASASVIHLERPCVARDPVSGYQPITGTISGGTPGGRFQIVGVAGKAGSFDGSFDGEGNAAFAITSYGVRGTAASRGQIVPLVVSELPAGASGRVITGTGRVKVTTLAFDVADRPLSAYAKRIWQISGLAPVTGDRTVWASWYRGRTLVARIKLGVANDCGYLRVQRSLFPARRYRSLTLRVHSQKTWSAKLLSLNIPVTVVRLPA